ncbi:6-phosphofructokinase [Clostridium hydrogeniformans]|uniref:6-phosphofructokinase n=1 Tax=Clostridium hydrogeniformans TaxID=349933 RepID=UPI000486D672|nr:6-phosphofructokinase [Clostridium hydrogeniformans]
MSNCIIAQSGGPTAVINASVIGVVEENFKKGFYENVYAGINGIEGILNKKLVNLSEKSKEDLQHFRFTPSSGLGSCRYKMKDFRENDEEYIKLFNLLKELNIDTFFYVGGNDSMDTVAKLSEYTKINNIPVKVIGIPKTIDNDLPLTDHTPGFGSAAKLISTLTLETYLDSSVYTNNGIFILETMGRDTGWLAASAGASKLNGKQVADFIYLPEVAFSTEKFLKDVEEKFKSQNQVYIVASEGLRDKDGRFISETPLSGCHDNFGHAQLGGVGNYLKNIIINAGITKRVKSLELGVIQRCSMHIASKIDLDEAYMVGTAALNYANEGHTGYMVAIKRNESLNYESSTFLAEASNVANNIKYVPINWINEEGNNVTEEAINYITPLIDNYIPSYVRFNK